MADHGIVIVLTGAKGAYTGALSTVVADILGWKWVRFSDFIRKQAVAAGERPDDTAVLQRLGQKLVRECPAEFVGAVLKMADWRSGENLVLDGLRHVEVFRELQKQVGPSADLRVVHIDIQSRDDRADRAKRSEGISDKDFNRYDKDKTEVQVEEAPAYANLRLNGSTPRGELANTIIRRFVPGFTSKPPVDGGENISAIEPLVIGSSLSSLARDLIRESASFAGEVPIGLAQPLAELVRAMNCYYSNLIEGHIAPLTDIELALNGDYEKDPKKRHLQAEARAHIAVQRWIDEGGLSDQPAAATQSLQTIHDRFFSEFPDSEWVTDMLAKQRALVVPGSYRKHFTKVGMHEPPSPGSIPRFMKRFEEVYSGITAPEEAILAAAPAHHRLLWIHPFGDGNGRVARLMSDAMLSRTLHTHSIWSASRGLAHHQAQYKELLAACDQSRRGDLDGRGNLSEKTLIDFTAFFLNTCLEQVRFMRKVMRLDELSANIDRWVETSAAYSDRGTTEEKHVPRLHPAAGQILKAVLDKGALTLAECREILGGHVGASNVIKQLEQHGVIRLRDEALTFALPAHMAERFLPGLFP